MDGAQRLIGDPMVAFILLGMRGPGFLGPYIAAAIGADTAAADIGVEDTAVTVVAASEAVVAASEAAVAASEAAAAVTDSFGS